MFTDKTVHLITPQIDIEVSYLNQELKCYIHSCIPLKHNIIGSRYGFKFITSYGGIYLENEEMLRIGTLPTVLEDIHTSIKLDENKFKQAIQGILECILEWYGRPILFDSCFEKVLNSNNAEIDLDPIKTLIQSQIGNADSEIVSYQKKIKPHFFGDGERHFGLEIEVELLLQHRLYNKKNVMKILKTQFGDFVYFKDDKSITTYTENSLEVITHPATLEYHLEHTILLLNTLKMCDCITTNNCGLHIHVSKISFGKGIEMCRNIGKLLKLEYKYHNYLVEYFGREDISKVKQHCKRVLPVFLDCTFSNKNRNLLGNSLMYQNYDEYLEWFKTNYVNDDRKYAINLKFNPTVEFRLPQGTLDNKTFVKYLKKFNKMIEIAVSKENIKNVLTD